MDPTSAVTQICRMRVLGVPISLVNLNRAVEHISGWAAAKSGAHTVFLREVASLMLAIEQPSLLELHEKASLVLADGTPLLWIGRLSGHGKELGRIAGADLVDAVCHHSLTTGQTHYFYGGKPGVAQTMADSLSRKYPGLKVAGVWCPPMLQIASDFRLSGASLAEAESIRASGADFVWVGISSPKQEYWMAEAAPVLGRGVLIGVGAAFDFHSGAIKRAPKWMRNNGLEWLHRLCSEPRRLWRRYLVLAPYFVFKVLVDLIPASRDRS